MQSSGMKMFSELKELETVELGAQQHDDSDDDDDEAGSGSSSSDSSSLSNEDEEDEESEESSEEEEDDDDDDDEEHADEAPAPPSPRMTADAIQAHLANDAEREGAMKFLVDVTIPDGSPVPVASAVVKQWKVSTRRGWGEGTTLRPLVDGSSIAPVAVPAAEPNSEPVLTLELTVPDMPGATCRSHWGLFDAAGNRFGDQLWVEFVATAAPAPAPAVEAAAPTAALDMGQASVQDIVWQLASASVADKTAAAKACRKRLAVARAPPVQAFVEAGAVPLLVQALNSGDDTLTFEAAWALTNIASGDSACTAAVVAGGALEPMARMLESPAPDVADQAVWCLGNIAGDSPQLRDAVLAVPGLVPSLVQRAVPNVRDASAGAGGGNNVQTLKHTRNTVWAMANLCRGKPAPDVAHVAPLLPALAQLVYHRDNDVLADACWALSYLSDGPNPHIQGVIESGSTRRLVELMCHPTTALVAPALRCVGNIVKGDDLQTQCVLNCGALPCLRSLLGHAKNSIRKEACRAVSNICAGNKAQIHAVVDSGIVPTVVEILQTSSDRPTRKEATWVIGNICDKAGAAQTEYVVHQGTVAALCSVLTCEDARMVSVALSALGKLLRHSLHAAATPSDGSNNAVAELMEECGGLDSVEALQHHQSNLIAEAAAVLLAEFFCSEEDEDAVDNAAHVASAAFEPAVCGFTSFDDVDAAAVAAPVKQRHEVELEGRQSEQKHSGTRAALKAAKCAAKKGAKAVARCVKNHRHEKPAQAPVAAAGGGGGGVIGGLMHQLEGALGTVVGDYLSKQQDETKRAVARAVDEAKAAASRETQVQIAALRATMQANADEARAAHARELEQLRQQMAAEVQVTTLQLQEEAAAAATEAAEARQKARAVQAELDGVYARLAGIVTQPARAAQYLAPPPPNERE